MTCEQYHGELVAFVRDEMAPLERRRLASHLGHCDACRRTRERIDAALGEARTFAPELPAEHIARLAGRLAPYIEAAQGRTAPRRLLLAGALAAGIAAVIGAALATARWPGEETAARTALAPTPYVRVVAGPGWDGVVQGDSEALVVHMTRGAAGFAFAGGEGRRLAVETPLGVARAVGTRFAVRLAAGGAAMTVSVADGEVELEARPGRLAVAVGAGEEVRLEDDGAFSRGAVGAAARDVLEDEFLVALPGHRGIDFAGTRTGIAVELSARAARPDVAGRLRRAERLAAQGRYAQALAIYAGCAREPGLELALADICRFESARLHALHLGAADRGREMLEELARSGAGEAKRQAMLGLCELLRGESACAAVACLAGLARASREDEALRHEAARLAGRWALGAGCGPREEAR